MFKGTLAVGAYPSPQILRAHLFSDRQRFFD
jgi:hypothetical protein